MVYRRGSRRWQNVHVTYDTQLNDLIDIDNAVASGTQPRGFDLLKRAASDIDTLIQEAHQKGKTIRALGAGWALTDIAIPDTGWLLNTKLLNGCFDISDHYFEDRYAEKKRPCLIVAQCGISVGELNIHLEHTATVGFRRALKTSGAGTGQTIIGAISGNTHGAAINFGAMPDFVVGMQIVNGSGQSMWVERKSEPVLNTRFTDKLEAKLVRDDDALNAAIVSFGAFGVITAVAIETDVIYQLEFPAVHELSRGDLAHKLNNFDYNNPKGLYHYQFAFNPYGKRKIAVEGVGTRVPYKEEHQSTRQAWGVRSESGITLGDNTPAALLKAKFAAGVIATAQYKYSVERLILKNVRATPGQLFSATVFYFERGTESSFGVSISDAAKVMDISADIIKKSKIPTTAYARTVHPTRALLGFSYLGPKCTIFECPILNDGNYPKFEDRIARELRTCGIRYTRHWSKNAGVDAEQLQEMYGKDRIRRWKAARSHIFNNNTSLMKVFDNAHIRRAGLSSDT